MSGKQPTLSHSPQPLLFEVCLRSIAVSTAMFALFVLQTAKCFGDDLDLQEQLAAIRREAVLLEKIGATWEESHQAAVLRAVYQVDRSSRTPSFGGRTHVEGLAGTSWDVVLQLEDANHWTFQGIAQPITFVGATQPADFPEAMEQRAARQEYLYQTRRKNAFDPPLDPMWQQPYSASKQGDTLTQFWGARKNAYPRVVVSKLLPKKLEAALVPRELMLCEALLLGTNPGEWPMVPIQLNRCQLIAEGVPFRDGRCVKLQETIPASTGFIRRELFLSELQGYRVVRAVYVPLDRTPEPRKRQPSEYAAQGEAADLDIPGERPESLVIDLRYANRRADQISPSGIVVSGAVVSWLNDFGGVSEFWELSLSDKEASLGQNPSRLKKYPEGTWIYDKISGKQTLVYSKGQRKLTTEDLKDVTEYADLFPQHSVSAVISGVAAYVARNPIQTMSVFWVGVILAWFGGRRLLCRFRGKPPNETSSGAS